MEHRFEKFFRQFTGGKLGGFVAKKANDDDALDIEISEVHDLLGNLGQRLLETAKTASDLEIEGIWRGRFGVITRARRLITALDERRRKT